MKRRTGIRIISFLAAGLLAALGFFLCERRTRRRYALELENNYSYTFEELDSAMNNISTLLSKAKYTTTASGISSMATQLLTEAELSKSAISQMTQTQELVTLNRFLSQVGNYAMAVSKSLEKNGELTEKEKSDIEVLSAAATKISDAIRQSKDQYNTPEYWASQLENDLKDSAETAALDASFGEVEEDLQDFPTLIYDGPYSDHLLKKESKLLEKAEEQTTEAALEIASRWSDCNPSELVLRDESNGRIKAYNFTGEGVDISITKQGAYPLYMRKSREPGDAVLTNEQAVEKAKRFLQNMEMLSFSETYYYCSDGICTVNFAYRDGRTVCYTDLIKVGVAMDNGEIMFYEAGGYLVNHTDRVFEAPKFTQQQALEVLSSKLQVTDWDLALIPTDSGTDVRCYEFNCVTDTNQEVLVYINAATLAEEEILLLYKSDGGTLVK